MHRPASLILATSLAMTPLGAAQAEVPQIATDIPPIHSLVAMVMDGVGAPALILPPGLSPHDAALRPSDAAALSQADLIIWSAPELSPAFARAVDAVGTGRSLVLMDLEGAHSLAFRSGAVFEEHNHGAEHDEHGHDEHGHDEHDHDEHGHDAEAHDDHGHDEEAHDAHGHDDHAHDGRDPHGWLDPQNAIYWLGEIANSLAALDPENAATYRDNAARAAEALTAQQAEIAARMAPLVGGQFVVFHDAYHYYEARFEVEAAGALSLGDGAAPGPQRLTEIRDMIAERDIQCVFSEPQYDVRLVETAIAEGGARIVEIDPLGANLTPGAGLYADLIEAMATSFERCLAPE